MRQRHRPRKLDLSCGLASRCCGPLEVPRLLVLAVAPLVADSRVFAIDLHLRWPATPSAGFVIRQVRYDTFNELAAGRADCVM